ncbi:hypothetical protein DQ244_17980 [Blastococcus sp. TBT05-19]|uniref:hypothetical protein n=1 Tax=Blastococcus sp. TBT05-19 TaxID=2250581 RepID=UPI000DEA49C7|nr:hypothetical protein [Blastococcus sp. TBT05-19]RBY87209.1 hypothetical protein DQ244_17980 [Blastococcus sp. TBT05-19]
MRRPATAIGALLVLLGACTGPGQEQAPEDRQAPLPGEPPAVVLQIGEVGGYVPATYALARLPAVTVYSDGRVVTRAPGPARFPEPALPALQVHRVDPGGLQELVGLAVQAGVTETGDLGSPSVTDLPDTRFELRAGLDSATRQVYALGIGSGPDADGRYGLTPGQVADRERLSRLVEQLLDLPGTLGPDGVEGPEPYAVRSVAAVAAELVEPGPTARPWPGPPLDVAGVGCVLVPEDQVGPVLDAAASATDHTPWTTADGRRWTVLLRPLLPHESGCEDLSRG